MTILTDHWPLKVLYTHNDKPSPHILQWGFCLQSYNFQIEHVQKKTNPAEFLPIKPKANTGNKIWSYWAIHPCCHRIQCTKSHFIIRRDNDESSKDKLLQQVDYKQLAMWWRLHQTLCNTTDRSYLQIWHHPEAESSHNTNLTLI